MNASELPAAWPVDSPWTLRDVRSSNNLSYVVETPNEQYLLRIYQNTADPQRIRYEHALLAHLAQLGLSFAVPAPIPTHSGVTLAEVDDGAGIALATLFRFIPGRHPDAGNRIQARACAEALGQLDEAFSRIDIRPPAGTLPAFGDLYHVHPAVPDPLAMLEELPLHREERAQLVVILQELLALIPGLYGSLPQQIVHRDFDGSNVLIEGARVTGVLDFEFAHPDLRAVDFAYALYGFTVGTWGTEEGEELIGACAAGYRDRVQLTPAEIEALPDLIRLYRMVSLIHREGRRRLGQAREEAVLTRVDMLLRLDTWLREHRGELVRWLMS